MSNHYWPIAGYGIEVKESMFDISKMRPLTDLNKEEYEELLSEDGGRVIFDDGFILSVLDILTPLLEVGDTANLHLGQFLIYPFKAPWLLEDEEKNITKGDVVKMIEDSLLPYLKAEFDSEWLQDNIDYIYKCGGG